ncbi:hypothetical protein chiPu_0003934 [Chiloscyllium punctatum]|uniref:Ubiquitin-like-conjugating enzyme ATG10 n=1 Tax=Chiloscyllium punctatum TaxID=137246 RepID=A0A401S546_CHIPU|nr:hypothetical protein [Chiloscyllium punctatum]
MSCVEMSHTFNRNENICLGEEQFQKFCKLFIKHSDEICNGWEWRQKELNEGYMVKVHLRSKISLNSLFVEDHCFQDLQGHEVDDKEKLSVKNVSSDIEEAQVTTSQLIRYEYHVVYSSSYQAPVLYFRACYSDGKPLTLEEIWENVHDCYKERLFQGPWDTITQQGGYTVCSIRTGIWCVRLGRVYGVLEQGGYTVSSITAGIPCARSRQVCRVLDHDGYTVCSIRAVIPCARLPRAYDVLD